MLFFSYAPPLTPAQIRRVCPGARLLGVGYLEGHTLAFPRYSTKHRGGVAGALRAAGEKVWGALYDVTEAHLATLDRHLEVPYAYHREEMEVVKENGRAKAWVYLANRTGAFLPHPSYVQGLVKAARELAFPQEYIEKLQGIKCRS